MKYYTYISDAKVDMLFPQVPHEIKKKVATEFGFDLKFLSAKRKAESESEENRITRLEVVAEYLRKSGKVGSVDEPDDYIADTLLMRTGRIGSQLSSKKSTKNRINTGDFSPSQTRGLVIHMIRGIRLRSPPVFSWLFVKPFLFIGRLVSTPALSAELGRFHR